MSGKQSIQTTRNQISHFAEILKKEQVMLFVINQVLCINVLNAICMCTGNASQPFTTVYKVILTFLIVFLKKFIHVSV